MTNVLWRVFFHLTWLPGIELAVLNPNLKGGRDAPGPLCMWGGWQDFHWLKTAQFCHFSIPGWTHLILFMPRSKAALELYKTWMGDHMENSAIVGIDQGLKGQPLVNTWPQALGVSSMLSKGFLEVHFEARLAVLRDSTPRPQAMQGGGWVLGHFRGDAQRSLNFCLQLSSFDASETFWMQKRDEPRAFPTGCVDLWLICPDKLNLSCQDKEKRKVSSGPAPAAGGTLVGTMGERTSVCTHGSDSFIATSSQEVKSTQSPPNLPRLLPTKHGFGPSYLMKQLGRQLEVLWGRSHSVPDFSLQGYKGDVSMSQMLLLVLVGDLKTSDGLRHPKNSGGISRFTKQISIGK